VTTFRPLTKCTVIPRSEATRNLGFAGKVKTEIPRCARDDIEVGNWQQSGVDRLSSRDQPKKTERRIALHQLAITTQRIERLTGIKHLLVFRDNNTLGLEQS